MSVAEEKCNILRHTQYLFRKEQVDELFNEYQTGFASLRLVVVALRKNMEGDRKEPHTACGLFTLLGFNCFGNEGE